MDNGANRTLLALALRRLSVRPKVIVDELQFNTLPDDRQRFVDYLESRRESNGGVLRRSSSPTVEEPALLDAGHAWDEAERTLDACHDQGIEVLVVGSRHFPPRLTALQTRGRDSAVFLGGYCPILYSKGNCEALNQGRAAAIIGTREPTTFGYDSARTFGRRLGTAGVVIVSGLARGCDTAAHMGCVDENGVGVAVMAHGLDHVYPPENEDLAERLIEHGGCLVSEYPPGVRPHRRNFGFRDRIQSALADLVIVIETPVRDGTMITVDYARKQGRRVVCLSHPAQFASEYQVAGNHRLLAGEYGATLPLRDPQDALRLISGDAEADDHRRSSGRLPL